MGGGQSAVEVGGFRIFKVNPGSPAFDAGLEVFFDFIVEIAGSEMDSHQKNFFEKIKESENQRTRLVVYNIRTHSKREVFVTPKKWGGAGLLGAVVRYDELENSDNQGIRVLEVFTGSPAAQAGLIPNKDFLLGTTEVMFRDMDELGEIVNICLGRKIQIYVYNTDTESIREVTIVPNTEWGGEGAIGADIRTGMLHRIPAPRRLGVASHLPPPADLLHAQVPEQQQQLAPSQPGADLTVSSIDGVARESAVHSDASPSADVNIAQQYVWHPEEKRYVYQEAASPGVVTAGTAALVPAMQPNAPAVPTLAALATGLDTSAQPSAPPQTGTGASLAAPPPTVAAPVDLALNNMRAVSAPSAATGDGASHQLPAAAFSSPAAVHAAAEAAIVQGASSVLAGLSASQQRESPQRSPYAAAPEPSTPAMSEPPKVPPSTPMNAFDVGQSPMATAFMSPSVVNIPDNIQGRLAFPDIPENGLTPGVILESSPTAAASQAPGVIFETPTTVPVA